MRTNTNKTADLPIFTKEIFKGKFIFPKVVVFQLSTEAGMVSLYIIIFKKHSVRKQLALGLLIYQKRDSDTGVFL